MLLFQAIFSKEASPVSTKTIKSAKKRATTNQIKSKSKKNKEIDPKTGVKIDPKTGTETEMEIEIGNDKEKEAKTRKKMTAINNKSLYLLAILCVILLSSCNRGELFFRFYHIPQSQWRSDAPVVFTMDSLAFRQDRKYQVFIELSANIAYPYRNIWLLVEHNLTDSAFRRDSLQVFLVNEHGRRLGSGVGGLRQLSAPFLSDISLNPSYIYQLKIGHGMRTNPLRGIEKVGVKVVEMN